MELASSDAAAILFFLKEEKEKNGGAKKGGQGRPPLQEVRCKPGGERADEYPRGAGRICNAPSSRTAALGIGPKALQNPRRACKSQIFLINWFYHNEGLMLWQNASRASY